MKVSSTSQVEECIHITVYNILYSILMYIIYIYICPLLLGGGGPTCRFIAIIWGGGPPQYTMF